MRILNQTFFVTKHAKAPIKKLLKELKKKNNVRTELIFSETVTAFCTVILSDVLNERLRFSFHPLETTTEPVLLIRLRFHKLPELFPEVCALMKISLKLSLLDTTLGIHLLVTAANDICPHGFKHYLQSVRVAERLEKNGQGLNLTHAVLNGIKCHTNAVADTKEGCVVRLADTIAYINHDIEDSIRAGILSSDSLPRNCVDVLGKTKTERITALIASVIEHGSYKIDFMPEIRKAHDELKDFMFESVYTNPNAKQEEAKAIALVEKLYSYFIEHPDKMPEEYQDIIRESDTDRAVCDYISGMSDSYAVDLYTELFVPKSWK